MLRISYLLAVEVAIFVTLAAVLLLRAHDVAVVRAVGGVLVAVALFAAVMLVGQRRLLKPFAKRVGICELCSAKQ